MAEHERFHYRDLAELTAAIDALGLDLPASDDVSTLLTPASLGRRTVPNRLAVHPMEGCDAAPDGAPGELTFRRYERFAAGGAGLIWLEATAVVPEGRANPRQLHLHDASAEGFAELVRRARTAAAGAGRDRPVLILQLTHSGRYSRPAGRPEPIIAHHSAVLDGPAGLPDDYPLITDDELDALQDAYVAAARRAAEAGFDGVDVKACHRYLVNELLASHTRAASRYGGDYDGRTRFLRETVAKVAAAVGERIEVACRLNVYDGIAHPFGWGVRADGGDESVPTPDLAEPIRLIGQLIAAGLTALSVTAGNPYHLPYVNRPADFGAAGDRPAEEHPLEGVARLADLTRQMQRAHPNLPVVAAGYTWLRQYFPHFAAATVAGGGASVVGLGRGALAYPDFAADLAGDHRLDRRKVCVLCSSCTQIMRDGGQAGCVVRDHAVYGPIFRAGRRRARQTLRSLADACRRCADPPCRDACPAGVDVPAFLDAVAADDFRAAYRVVREAILLPAACGAVCPAEVNCQGPCIRALVGAGPVPVNEIHRHVGEMAVRAGWAALPVPGKATGRRAAIVGAGPAGLACAAELLARGHAVEVFERAGVAGGKLVSVIPAARSGGADAVGREIDAVFGAVPPDRLAWRFDTGLGPARTLDDLLGGGFDAVCLAFGLGNAAALTEPAGRCEGVIEAGAFLAQLNAHPDHRVAGDVAIIGGGNTAADAAVMARRRGARDVYVLYRRGWSEMPAWPEERREVLDAGVHLLLLTQAAGYVADAAGRLQGVRTVRTHLGDPDASGRRRPEQVPHSDAVMPVQLAIEAMGEAVEAGIAEILPGVEFEGGTVEVDAQTLITTRDGVFAAGDLVNGGTTVARALAEGREAGIAMARFLASP